MDYTGDGSKRIPNAIEKKAGSEMASRSLNVLKKCEKGLLILIRQSFFWRRYLSQHS
jgi:hypothetical protein